VVGGGVVVEILIKCVSSVAAKDKNLLGGDSRDVAVPVSPLAHKFLFHAKLFFEVKFCSTRNKQCSWDLFEINIDTDPLLTYTKFRTTSSESEVREKIFALDFLLLLPLLS
jgi:hypothetical protein